MSGRKGTGRSLDDLFEAAGGKDGERRALIMVGVVGLALMLILVSFLVGRGVAGGADEAGGTAASSADGADPGDSGEPDNLAEAALGGDLVPGQSPKPTRSAHPGRGAVRGRLTGQSWSGAVRPTAVRGATASCRSASGVDAGGNPVTYPANNMLDTDPSTAWRCVGNGAGVTLQLNLAGPQEVGAVGLVPGYAKTDAYSGADRYAENRRIARVRWTFGDGRWVEQTLNTDPSLRSLQSMRIPPVRTGHVTLTIQDSAAGPRNTVAISTVQLGGTGR